MQSVISFGQVTEFCVKDLSAPADVYRLDATTWNFYFYNLDNYILHLLCCHQKDFKVRPSGSGNARVRIASVCVCVC